MIVVVKKSGYGSSKRKLKEYMKEGPKKLLMRSLILLLSDKYNAIP